MQNLQGCCDLSLCLSSGSIESLLILSRTCLRPETKAGHTAAAVFVNRLSQVVHFVLHKTTWRLRALLR